MLSKKFYRLHLLIICKLLHMTNFFEWICTNITKNYARLNFWKLWYLVLFIPKLGIWDMSLKWNLQFFFVKKLIEEFVSVSNRNKPLFFLRKRLFQKPSRFIKIIFFREMETDHRISIFDHRKYNFRIIHLRLSKL